MAQVKTVDVDAWMKRQMGQTLLSKRRSALGAWRKKESPKKLIPESTGITLEKVEGF
jgi:hypothetical protein